MPRSCEPLTIARKGRSLCCAAAALCAALVVGAGLARAQDAGDNTYTPQPGITVTPSTDVACPSKSSTFAKFDISWWDETLGVFLLADRTNCSLDVFDTYTNTELFSAGGFSGALASNDISGPDGVVSVNGRWAFVGNGDSTVRVVDLFRQKQVATVDIPKPAGVTSGQRADEMAYDPDDHEIIVANDAPLPATARPFVTFISTTPQLNGTNPPTFGVLGQITFVNATGGLEQSVWSPDTRLFYISVPIVNGTATTGTGEIAIIDPKERRIVSHINVSCQPAGLAIGPDLEAIVGCSNGPVQIVSLKTGQSLASFPTLAGADEVWFNPGSHQYFVAASGNTVKKRKKVLPAPELGVINAATHALVQLIPTAAGDHSVTVDAILNHVFLPNTNSPPNPAFTNCTTGCVTIFNVSGEAVASR